MAILAEAGSSILNQFSQQHLIGQNELSTYTVHCCNFLVSVQFSQTKDKSHQLDPRG